MNWRGLENAAPELAAFGLKRFRIGVAYLGASRRVTPRSSSDTYYWAGSSLSFHGTDLPKRT